MPEPEQTLSNQRGGGIGGPNRGPGGSAAAGVLHATADEHTGPPVDRSSGSENPQCATLHLPLPRPHFRVPAWSTYAPLLCDARGRRHPNDAGASDSGGAMAKAVAGTAAYRGPGCCGIYFGTQRLFGSFGGLSVYGI